MCCYKNTSGKIDVSEKVVNNTIELTKELMKKYNIPIENVLRHYDVTGKNCPAPFVEYSIRWVNFLNKLKEPIQEGYKQGEAVEINVPFLYTGAEVNDRYLYDNFTEQCWIYGNTRSLIKDNKLIARAIFVYDNNEKCLVQVFDDQFWIKKKEITKKL